jgi:Methylase involved in ubiquinone/menaquinone biosynthesis
MQLSREEILEIMNNNCYPLSSKYNPDWILQNAIGSHCLWLQESLTQVMGLTPDMRVLDMGCGKAISSIFLAKEFEVRVWATDLRNSATDNWKRILEMGVGDKVCPIRADANDLPFADDYFDAMLSVNSLFLYATGEEFLKKHLLRNVKPGGEIGIIVPSFLHEYTDNFPESYKPYIDADGWRLRNWHTAAWWKNHLEKTGMVDIVIADNLFDDDGVDVFHKSARMVNAHEEPFNIIAWDDITFTRIIAKRRPQYD